jgi:hypothetical protein
MISKKFKLFGLLFLGFAVSLLWIGFKSLQQNNNPASTSALIHPSGKLIDGETEKLPLSVFLSKYEQISGIKIYKEIKIPDDIYISSQLLTLPPEDALLKALTNFSVLLGYTARTEQNTSRMKEVWIYAQLPDLNSMVAKKSNTPPQNNLNSLRAEEVVDIIARGDKEAVQVIDQALHDENETVRYHALMTASESESNISSSTLINMLQTDPSEIVRGVALTALQKNPEIDEKTFETLLNRASVDPSTYVQSVALDILAESGRLKP